MIYIVAHLTDRFLHFLIFVVDIFAKLSRVFRFIQAQGVVAPKRRDIHQLHRGSIGCLGIISAVNISSSPHPRGDMESPRIPTCAKRPSTAPTIPFETRNTLAPFI
jgi:hypothetical protein